MYAKPGSGRVTNGVMNMDRLRGFHYEAVANAVVNLEHHQRAGFFVGQSHLAAAETILHLRHAMPAKIEAAWLRRFLRRRDCYW